MSLELTDTEEVLFKESQVKLIIKLEEDIAREESLNKKLAHYQEVEALNEKIWLHYHYIILNYEKVIQTLEGTYIKAPFTNQDVVNLARNKGRLYQGTVSTSAKVIPQMVGGNTAQGAPNSARELDNYDWITALIGSQADPTGGILQQGTQNGSWSTAVYGGYTAGDSLSTTSRPPAGWALLGNNTLVFISSRTDVYSTGSPGPPAIPPVYLYTVCRISNRVNDTSYAAGTSVAGWSGYSNTERTSAVASSTTQALYNALILQSPDSTKKSLKYALERWNSFVGHIVYAQEANDSPTMTDADRKAALDLQTYLNDYIVSMPVYDGILGINGLQDQIENRLTVTLPETLANSYSQKELFYAPRISYTNMRGDIQNGSLTTVFYLEMLLSKYPDPWLKQVEASLWILKKELES